MFLCYSVHVDAKMDQQVIYYIVTCIYLYNTTVHVITVHLPDQNVPDILTCEYTVTWQHCGI